MDEESYLNLERKLRVLSAQFGADRLSDSFIADGELLEEGGRRPFTAQQRVLIRLEALLRHMSLIDRTVYENAMAKIKGVLAMSAAIEETEYVIPDGVKVTTVVPGQAGETIISLARLPDLNEELNQLKRLIELIRADEYGDGDAYA